jgi:hypothetical protein
MAFSSDGRLHLLRMECADNAEPTGPNWWKKHRPVCRLRHLGDPDSRNTPPPEIGDFTRSINHIAMTADGRRAVVVGNYDTDPPEQAVAVFGVEDGSLVRHISSTNSISGANPVRFNFGERSFFVNLGSDRRALIALSDGHVDFNANAPRAFGLGDGYELLDGWRQQVVVARLATSPQEANNRMTIVEISNEIFSTIALLGAGREVLALVNPDATVSVVDLPMMREQFNALGLSW